MGEGGACPESPRRSEGDPFPCSPVLSTAEEPALPSLPQLTTLNQHWHEQDPYGAPLDSTHPARPLGGRDPTPQLGGEEVF